MALGFDSFDDRSAAGPAVQSAVNTALVNSVIGAAPSATPTDVTFPVGPTGLANRVLFRDRVAHAPHVARTRTKRDRRRREPGGRAAMVRSRGSAIRVFGRYRAAFCRRRVSDWICKQLFKLGADVRTRNRRGAEPLHAAAAGAPGGQPWNPKRQAATIELLIDAGADPDCLAAGGVAPRHVAVRTRCAAAVQALLERGANPRLSNDAGSTPLHLAVQTTGKGGSGTPEAKAQQTAIIRLLIEHGARTSDKDGRGKTVAQRARRVARPTRTPRNVIHPRPVVLEATAFVQPLTQDHRAGLATAATDGNLWEI
jgi:hypothetical protein